MSSNLFANRKNALGFAGVILAIAVVGTYSAGAFLPFLEEPEEPQPAEVTEAPAPTPTPQRAGSTWADGGFSDDGLADDWGAGASGPAFNQGRARGSSNDLSDPDFGDYTPDAAPRSAGASRNSSGSGGRSPTIRSGAAPGAPRVNAPGGSGNGGDSGGGQGELKVEG